MIITPVPNSRREVACDNCGNSPQTLTSIRGNRIDEVDQEQLVLCRTCLKGLPNKVRAYVKETTNA